jgi:hypothetical protein
VTAESGQATVELVGLMPLVALIAIAGFTAVSAFTAHEQAGSAAEAGAIALLQDGDARAAALAALPTGIEHRAEIEVDGRLVTVTVRPRVPLLARHLEATVTTDAGPKPRP